MTTRLEKAVEELTVRDMKLFGRSTILATITMWTTSMKPVIDSMKELGAMFGESAPDNIEDRYLELMRDVMPIMIGSQMGRMYQNSGQFYADIQQGTVTEELLEIEEHLKDRTRDLFGEDTF